MPSSNQIPGRPKPSNHAIIEIMLIVRACHDFNFWCNFPSIGKWLETCRPGLLSDLLFQFQSSTRRHSMATCPHSRFGKHSTVLLEGDYRNRVIELFSTISRSHLCNSCDSPPKPTVCEQVSLLHLLPMRWPKNRYQMLCGKKLKPIKMRR